MTQMQPWIYKDKPGLIFRMRMCVYNLYYENMAKMCQSVFSTYDQHHSSEMELLRLLDQWEDAIVEAAQDYDPSVIANFCFDLAKAYHKFYHEVPILAEQNQEAKQFRLALCVMVGNVLQYGMNLLGIDMPDKM